MSVSSWKFGRICISVLLLFLRMNLSVVVLILTLIRCFIAWFRITITRARNVMVASGLVVFAAAGLAFPFSMETSRRPVDSSKLFPPQATSRGPYVNTGSRDVGPDHQTYTKK